MPELSDDMYCSQQISIPPTFPYVLRQYCKSAIRTQPSDLLKWSTTYFRCLSLNFPPPVKLRLEYPIPTDWHGLTPGWIKALYFQMNSNATVSFTILWDRWIGACLEHTNLIQILCLGGFTDPQNISWIKFIALCAGFISDSLTDTMILICEILTQEPDGGSAMIMGPTFLELYKFLGAIDASKPLVLKNKYFPDSFLKLVEEKKKKFEESKKFEPVLIEQEESVESEEAQISEAPKIEKDLTVEISCPSIGDDEDMKPIEAYLDEADKAEAGTDIIKVETGPITSQINVVDETAGSSNREEQTDVDETTEDPGHETEGGRTTQDTEDVGLKDKARQEKFRVEERQKVADMLGADRAKHEEELIAGKSAAGHEEVEVVHKVEYFEDEGLLEDLEKLKVLQEEMAGESDQDLEQFKKELIDETNIRSPSEDEAISHFTSKAPFETEEKLISLIAPEITSKTSTETVDEGSEDEEKAVYEDVPIPAVPGIGPLLTDELVKAVETYMKEMAKLQHGMVMPRNIRHYDCPPLEVRKYTEEKQCH